MHSNSPIAVFDSGLGGLTVLKHLENKFPNENFIYFGDTSHVPYGTKSAEAVIRYSKSIMDFFQKHNTKAVVIACNTASAVAFQHLQELYNIPLFDVVTPSVEFAINHTKKSTHKKESHTQKKHVEGLMDGLLNSSAIRSFELVLTFISIILGLVGTFSLGMSAL